MNYKPTTTNLPSLLAALLLGANALAAEPTFYKVAPLFSTAPDPLKSVETITRFGPVGIAVELHQPAFAMQVGDVEKGSPAEAAGLKKGQFIQSINGQVLKDIDPRIQLGGIIEAAEAADGVLKFIVKENAAAAAKEVVVKIPALGAYAKTWPLNCAKSDKIVRNFADYLAKPGTDKGFADFGMLFLLSTGEEKDLAVVREWVRGLAKKNASGYAWHIGFGGIPLCEYYLRTGDAEALPIIQKWVEAAAKGEYLDAWAGRGGVPKLSYGNGHLNAGGTAVVTFLMLAKQCGAEVDESLLNRTLVHFFRYAGRGINPYGDDRPETSFVDNGKHGNLAFAMASAALLTPDGEKSIYAKARDICAMTSFYTTTFMLHGHTGGGIGEIWRSASMGLLHEKKPLQYREFMDHRKWHYDMSRRFDGSFGILGGAGYDDLQWGACYPLAYTIPRKTLRITGAAPAKFSKTHPLPARPWGTEADDVFLSMEPAASKGGKPQDISGEVLTKDSAKPLILRLKSAEQPDDEIRRYVFHPEYIVRYMAANMAAGLTADYMFPKPGQRVRTELLEEFSRHTDPRVRNAGLRASIRGFNPADERSQRLFAFAVERLKDESESWFIKDTCLSLIAQGTADMIVPHVDLLITFLKHKEQWLQNGALNCLAKVIADERAYAKVLPPVSELIRSTPRQSTTSGPIFAIRQQLPKATPKVRDLALKTIGDSYVNYSGGDKWIGGQDMISHRKDTLAVIATALAEVPGGFDVLYQVSKKQFPGEPLPHDEIFLKANPEKFGPELKAAILPLIREKLIYQYIGENRRTILSDIAKPAQRSVVTNTLDGLVDLYQKIGVRDYDWKPFGPDLKNAQWNYHSFDPKETQKHDLSPWRYRTVTYPAGMENWFARDFDPAKVGWKKGQFPIGQFDGKLGDIKSPYTVWGEKPRTLWEKEVLLVNGTFDLPALKPGHSYRLRVQTGQGVGAGDGFKVFINGKPLVENKLGLGRREGDSIRGGWITAEFGQEFGKSPVTIAATTFLKYGDRAIVTMPPVPRGIFSMWLEERKLPPLDDAVLRKAAVFTPMLSSEWQMQNDPVAEKTPPDEDKYHYDGKHVANPAVIGAWTVIEQVASIDSFTGPAKKPNLGRPLFRTITFKPDGTTNESRWIWTGDMLLDLENSVAHKITPKTIEGTAYLIIESGGFSTKNPAGWQTPLMVLKQ